MSRGFFRLLGKLDRRQGRWEEAVRSYERAVELDPRDSFYSRQVGSIYMFQRRFAEAGHPVGSRYQIVP